MTKSFDDTGLSLFKGSDDTTKLRAFELENKTRQQALWHLSTQQQLETWFAQRGIDPSMPGVHDTAGFLCISQCPFSQDGGCQRERM